VSRHAKVSIIAAQRQLRPDGGPPAHHLPFDRTGRILPTSLVNKTALAATTAAGDRKLDAILGDRRRATPLQAEVAMTNSKTSVYVSRSAQDCSRYYTGVTSNVRARLAAHNAGRCSHTADGRPWHLDVLVRFADEPSALAFERYLKSGSGCSFAKRHFR
jgi:putative endonuclease